MEKENKVEVKKPLLEISANEIGEQFVYEEIDESQVKPLFNGFNEAGYYKIDGHNMGWDSRSGYMYQEIHGLDDITEYVTPKTSEFALQFFKFDDHIQMRCAHHDSPMWAEYYNFFPVSEEEYLENK